MSDAESTEDDNCSRVNVIDVTMSKEPSEEEERRGCEGRDEMTDGKTSRLSRNLKVFIREAANAPFDGRKVRCSLAPTEEELLLGRILEEL